MKEEILKNKEARAKKMMLLFALLSITMTFGGLTSAYVVSKGRPDWLEDLILPISFTYSTLILFLSSFTIHLSKFFLNKPNGKSNSLKFLILTFILGIAFLFFQFDGFNEFVKNGYYFAGAQSNVTTSFIYVLAFVHILHLIAGLIVLIVLIFRLQNNKYQDSKLGFTLGVNFWHFLDLLWLYLFLFFYFFG
ncbi:MAG: cytochrome c oxidase subunit 3 [Bacteroidota bacterium]|nr:cytochrome c oxidase subunit 3 [Bacteroidota bacterium]MEC8175523.1 cytochrome c oxidase subunit 3 [Bacteroidota bacterium]MEC8602004.1 cytochrome c oxidase subunit 3 [Bacteroidota bacterium]